MTVVDQTGAGLLDALYRSALFDTESRQAIERLLRLAANALGAPLVILSIGDRERHVLRGHVRSGPDTVEESLAAFTPLLQLAYGRPTFVFTESLAGCIAPHGIELRGTFGATPLQLPGSEQSLGTLAVADVVPRADRAEIAAVLADFAAELLEQLMLRVENASLRDKAAHLESQKHLFGLIAAGAPIERVLSSLASYVEHQSQRLCVVHLSGDDGLLHVVGGPTLPESLLALVDGVPPAAHGCVAACAAHCGEPVIIDDIAQVAHLAPSLAALHREKIRSGWSFPIQCHESVCGTIDLYGMRTGVPTEEELQLIAVARSVAAIAIERHRSEEALRANEERYRLIARASSDLIWEWDVVRDVTTWPGEDEVRFGYQHNELPETAAGWASLVHPDDRARVEQSLQQIIAGAGETWSQEYRLQQRDGGYATVLDRGIVIRAPDGTASRVIGSLMDLTARRALEDQLRHAQRMEAVGRLAGGIAHDFNNLLTVIDGFTALLLSDLAGTEHYGALDEIHKASARAASLTRQLLAFSRRQVLQPRVVDLNEVVTGLGGMLRRLTPADVVLNTQLEHDASIVRADIGQIEQVIVNLVINAREAMENGGIITLRTGALELPREHLLRHPGVVPGRYARLTVEDTGCGMEPELIARIFDPFFTTKQSGTGLGLATVYGIVEQSGGHIEVRSNIGQGSRFDVYLPIAHTRSQAASPSAAGERSAPGGNEIVLVIEDDPAVRALTCRLLSRHGYVVHAAAEGSIALDMIQSHGLVPDLLLTDVVLPRLSGPVVAQRALELLPNTAVVYMSGYTDEQIGQHGVIGADVAFIQKPFASTKLLAIIREQLDARAVAQAMNVCTAQAIG